MSRLDDIERLIDERMREIDRKIEGKVGGNGAAQRSSKSESPGYGDRRAAVSPLSIAPFNPDFVDWAQGSKRASGFRGGLVPQPFDFSYMSSLPSMRGAARSYPPKFDLRDRIEMMPVRDQGSFGTCWAHAALASMETSILVQGRRCEDFSENNLANLSGFDNSFGAGGNGNMAAAYLLRWDGPVLERDDPYGRPGASRSLPAVAHLQSFSFVQPMRDAADISGFKAALTTMGAVWVGYLHDGSGSVYRADTGAFCLHGEPSADSGWHAVVVVGWDDSYPASNFAVPPPGDGAWIVRNSWGTEFGKDGYFYVSYHDKTFGRAMPGYVFSGVERSDNYDDVLQYDRLGLVTRCGTGEHGKAANVFVAPRDMAVEAVGFYALTPNASYRIAVHVDCAADDPETGVASQETLGTSQSAGFVTVKLSASVSVAAGRRFSVVVDVTTPGCEKPIGVECAFPRMGTSKAEAAPGQSFINVGGRDWVDLMQIEPTANFCCKAYVSYCADGSRSWKRFCSKCGTYTYTETSTGGKCSNCGAWL